MYVWFSKDVTDKLAGTGITGLDGIERIHKGFGVVLDLESDKLYQSTQGTPGPTPPFARADLQLVAVFENPQNNAVAVDAFGQITPLGEQFCDRHKIPATAESLISHVENFYTPRPPAGYTPPPVDMRKLYKPSTPPGA